MELIDAMTDDMIDTSDVPPLTENFFATAKWRMPKTKVKVTVEVESGAVSLGRHQNSGYQYFFQTEARVMHDFKPLFYPAVISHIVSFPYGEDSSDMILIACNR